MGGPCGVDLGSILFSYISTYVYRRVKGDTAAGSMVKRCIEGLLHEYIAGMGEEAIGLSVQDGIGYAACEVIRMALGCAGCRGFPADDVAIKHECGRRAVQLGLALMLRRAEIAGDGIKWVSLLDDLMGPVQ